MNKILGFELQDQIVRYLAGRISLREFRNWFDSASWNIEIGPDSRVYAMFAEIELRLAEFSSGHWTEEELQGQLKKLLPNHSILVEMASNTISGSSLRIEDRTVGKILSVGTRPAWTSV